MKHNLYWHLRNALANYRKHPTSNNLRWYLTWKAKLGRWDPRYCAYFGVPTQGITPWVRRFITRGFAAGLVCTATTNGVHAPGSFHSSGHAADMGLRTPEIGTPKGVRKLRNFQRSEYDRWLKGKGHATEIIGPIDNLIVLKGIHSPLAHNNPLALQHDNHVHGARA